MVDLRLFLLPLALFTAACPSDAGLRPLPNAEGTGEVLVTPVDPAIDSFFRGTRAAQSNALIAGDSVQIKVEGVDFTVAQLERRIPLDGAVPLPKTAHTIQAVGKTAQQIESAVAAAYAEKYENPYVTVTVMDMAPRYVYVTGEVRSPQRYDIGGTPLTVMQAITLAGGPTKEASMARVRVQRYYPAGGREVSSAALDLESVMDSGLQGDNILVAPGDTIVVPKAALLKVHILGHVETPGALDWYPGLTLTKAITECGGFRKFAKRWEISVIRADGTRIEFDFDKLIEGAIPDLTLEPRDRIFVPEKWI